MVGHKRLRESTPVPVEGAAAAGLAIVAAVYDVTYSGAAARAAARIPHRLGYPGSGPVCGERTLTTAQKLSERTNRARIISICPLHNIVGV